MEYTFTKTLVDEFEQNLPLRRQLRLITVRKETNESAGEFYFYPHEQFLKFDGDKVWIEVNKKLFKKTRHSLLNAPTNEKLGEFEITGGEINYSWKDVPSSPNAIICIGDNSYNFRRIVPDSYYGALSRLPQDEYKFLLYATRTDEFVEYKLKIGKRSWGRPLSTNLLPFQGTIQTNSTNLLLILSAFYLMEIEFIYEDHENSG